MSLIIEYNQLNSTLSPEENAINHEVVAEIIKNNQLRSIGITNENSDNNVRNKWYRLRYGGCRYTPERHGAIISHLKTDYGMFKLSVNSNFEIDWNWNWNDYDKLTSKEKQQIETFIKQYIFDKFRGVL